MKRRIPEPTGTPKPEPTDTEVPKETNESTKKPDEEKAKRLIDTFAVVCVVLVLVGVVIAIIARRRAVK